MFVVFSKTYNSCLTLRKKDIQIPIEEHCMKGTDAPPNCQGRQNQGESQKLSQPTRALRRYDTTLLNVMWCFEWDPESEKGH